MVQRLDGMSLDLEQVQIKKLQAVFPECFTEGKLDINKLLSLCGEYITDDFEKYQFTWKGKSECLRLAQKRSSATLRPNFDGSVNWDTTGNLYIEGENLEVLKLLQDAYYGKIKFIYIDPPYNTGNDFIYEDNFTDPLARYKEVTQQTTKSNPETMGRFHTRWLNLMYPRLRLAANLLKEEGVIFISIDDNELANLRKLCDDVFGEENFIGNIIWKNATDNNPTQIAIEHEYVLCYAKRKTEVLPVWKTKVSEVKDILIQIGNELNAKYEDPEQLQKAYTEWYRKNRLQLWPLDRYRYIDKGGVYTGSQSVHNPGREGYRYDVIHPVTKKPCVQPLLGYRFPEATMQELISSGRILFGEDHTKIVELKVYAKDYEEKLSSVFELDGRLGAYDLKALFGELPIFNNPKPVQLLKKFLSFMTEKDDIILDFFSGSGTIAQSTMELNDFDGNQRKFICIQLPENLDKAYESSDQKRKEILKNALDFLNRANRPHTLAEIGKERIRRSGRRIIENRLNEIEKKAEIDVGFRAFYLDSSNLKQWDTTPTDDINFLLERMNTMITSVKSDRSDWDVVYEIMLKLGIALSEPVESFFLDGLRVYKVGCIQKTLICLQAGITVEHIEAMAESQPQTIVLAEGGLEDNSVLANAQYILDNCGISFHLV